jgi:uncharacterized repeat protein (TIGR02543 family)
MRKKFKAISIAAVVAVVLALCFAFVACPTGGGNSGPDIGRAPSGDDDDGSDNGNDNGSDVLKYTVAFNSNGGSAVPSQKVEQGKAANTPTQPTKFGFDFDNWYGDWSFTVLYDFTMPVYSDLILYANWNGKPQHKKGVADMMASRVK